MRIARAQLRYKICFQAPSAFTFSGTLFYRAYMGNAPQGLFEPRWLLAEGTLDVSLLNGGQRRCLEGSRDLSPDQVALLPTGLFYLGAAWTGNASSQPPGATVSYEVEELRFILSGSVSPF
ncbi:hypothetical protein [Thermus sp.]|uniref:hypothetical protein n=1 Tax=Thermus sp. TaxID=275 RepID=UPI0025EBD59F|nr:hypothetical protein [Thermus sp.]MCS6869532.1 hypothetical protein [Thermus sp.]MCX7850448.1 hypothetical protein [Thermus sp.]